MRFSVSSSSFLVFREVLLEAALFEPAVAAKEKKNQITSFPIIKTKLHARLLTKIHIHILKTLKWKLKSHYMPGVTNELSMCFKLTMYKNKFEDPKVSLENLRLQDSYWYVFLEKLKIVSKANTWSNSVQNFKNFWRNKHKTWLIC